MDETELIKKYSIDIEKIKAEQLKLAKTLNLKDSFDFSMAEKFGAIENVIVKNKIISAVVVCDKENNIIEQEYFTENLRFPYLFGFRSYREVSAMAQAFNKLQDRPDVVFIKGHGISHPRLGLASHFSLLAGIPAIGVEDFLFEENKVEDENIIKDGKKVGKILVSKEGSKPLYISPGDKISIGTSYELAKKALKFPHKFPEPMHLAHKYAKEIQEELSL